LTVDSWPGRYFDVSRDNRITTLDALQVLNFLALIGSGEGEAPLSSGDLSGTVERFADHPGMSWLMWGQRPQEMGLMLGQRIDPVRQSGVQIQLQLEDANNTSTELIAKITSDLLSSGSQIWADRVDKVLSEGLGFPEQL
jgi:hypothetical protein